jgi:uroporphyrinogen decarboxylase
MERAMISIGHEEPDRVPLFLLFALYGAKEIGMHPKDYFSKASNVVEAQLKMREKYKNDCYYTFFYAGIEIQAMGGDMVFIENGPPNSGDPIIKTLEDIENFEIPDIKDNEYLDKVLAVTEELNRHSAGKVPIIGVVMSPFSLPVMQMGFERYLELIYENKEYFDLLMRKNSEFCSKWANAQLEAGATAICYFNPLASPNMIERETYLSSGYPVDVETIAAIKGATATHLASGIALPVLDDLVAAGTPVLGFSANDNAEDIKRKSKGRICLLGNLNAIDMMSWDSRQTKESVMGAIKSFGKGGGFILSDNHGEIPWQVPQEVLLHIAETVGEYGQYPLDWIDCDE